MTRLPPATERLPVRTDLFRGNSGQTASAESGRLSLTVTIEEQPDRVARRFAFRAARQAERRSFSRRSTDRAIADEPTSPIIDHQDPHDSSCFLAGAIAQARPGVTLHNPRYREAAGAYRRSDLLGLDAAHGGHRSDKKV